MTELLQLIEMLLLPTIKPDYIHKGWWRNLAAPLYRQYLWTATNLEVAIILGLLAIAGTVASDRLWPIIRRGLQPALQLSDPESKRLKLSRSDAIKSLWRDIVFVKRDLVSICGEEHDNKCRVKHKAKRALRIMMGSQRKILRPMETTVALRFGIFALINILSFFVLGIFIPFFLAEGLQGEATVQAFGNRQFLNYTKWYWGDSLEIVHNERVSQSVEWDTKRCFAELGAWKKTDYCMELRNGLPPYAINEMDPANPLFDQHPYQFLKYLGDPGSRPFKLSRNTSLRYIGFNIGSSPDMFHELTCVPVMLDQLIHPVDRLFSLKVNDLSIAAASRFNQTVYDTMILKTSNSEGSGFALYESYHRNEDHRSHSPNAGDQGALFYQVDVDGTLPYVGGLTRNKVMTAAWMIKNNKEERPQQNFLITFKPAQQLDLPPQPSDDPVFGTFRPSGSNTDFAIREVSALGCTEVFSLCSQNQCSDPPSFRTVRNWQNNIWMHRAYHELMSVWLNLLVESIYSNPGQFGGTRNFFERRRWQEEVEERFVRSMLRVRHGSKLAAERDFLHSNPPDIVHSQLYGNADYTNVNILGLVSVACGYLYIIAASYWDVLLLPFTVPPRFLGRCTRMLLPRLHMIFQIDGFRRSLANKTVQIQLQQTVAQDGDIRTHTRTT